MRPPQTSGVLMWLSDRSPVATGFAKSFLASYSGVGNDINGNWSPARVPAGPAASTGRC